MSLKKRFSLWAMLAIALAFFQPLKAENYGATITVDAPREVNVTELISNPYPSTIHDVRTNVRIKNGFRIVINVGSVPNFQSITDVYGCNRIDNGKKIEITEAGSASFVYYLQAPGSPQQSYRVVMHVNYYGVLQYQGSDAPASIDVTLDNQNQTLSVPAGKFPAIIWMNSGTQLTNVPLGTASVSLKTLLESGHTDFTLGLDDGTSNALPDGTGGGTSQCSITLVDKRTPATVSVTGVTLSESAKTLTVGETFQLTPNVQPPTATVPIRA